MALTCELSPTQRAQAYRAYLVRLKHSSQQSAIEDKCFEQESEELIRQSMRISKNFCDWVEGIDGEDNALNIRANDIISLFAIGDEKAKVALSQFENDEMVK